MEPLRADIGIYVNAQLVGALRQATLRTLLDSLPAASPDEYGWDWFIGGMLGWEATAEYLVLADEAVQSKDAVVIVLEQAQYDRTPVDVMVSLPGGETRTGQALITELTQGGSFDQVMVGSFSLQGLGELLLSLAAPVLQATGAVGQVDLTWGTVPGALSYTLLRAEVMGGPYTELVAGLTGLSYHDTAVVAGTTYYYVARAVAGPDQSPNSPEATATPT